MWKLFAVSTLLLTGLGGVAIGCLWIASYFIALDVRHISDASRQDDWQSWKVFVDWGTVTAASSSFKKSPPLRNFPHVMPGTPGSWEFQSTSRSSIATPGNHSRWLGQFDFRLSSHGLSPSHGELLKYRGLKVPFWMVFLPLWTPTILWHFWRRRKQKLAMAGNCKSCGYDLRASKDRCPECGTPIVHSSLSKGVKPDSPPPFRIGDR